MLTAITLITNPAFVLGNAFPYPTNPVLGETFCRVIWSRAFVFQLVVFSVYLSWALTAERWFAIVKPHKYGTFFTKKRILIYVVSSWVWSFALTSSGVIEKATIQPPTRSANTKLIYWAPCFARCQDSSKF